MVQLVQHLQGIAISSSEQGPPLLQEDDHCKGTLSGLITKRFSMLNLLQTCQSAQISVLQTKSKSTVRPCQARKPRYQKNHQSSMGSREHRS
jgi:hypothetical protein